MPKAISPKSLGRIVAHPSLVGGKNRGRFAVGRARGDDPIDRGQVVAMLETAPVCP